MKTKKQGNYLEARLKPNSMLRVFLGDFQQISLEVIIEADGQMIIDCRNPDKISLIKGTGIIEKIEDKTGILQLALSVMQDFFGKVRFACSADTLNILPRNYFLNRIIHIAKGLQAIRDSCREPYRQ